MRQDHGLTAKALSAAAATASALSACHDSAVASPLPVYPSAGSDVSVILTITVPEPPPSYDSDVNPTDNGQGTDSSDAGCCTGP